MSTATYKLAKYIDRLPHYAEVTVTAEFADEHSILVSPEAFFWLREAYGPNAIVDGPSFDEYQAAAKSGAEFALKNISGRESAACARVVIDRIHVSSVDTRSSDIAFAACYAVWQALRVQGRESPAI